MIGLLHINFAIQILQSIRDRLSQDSQVKHVREKIIALYPWYESYEPKRKKEILISLYNRYEISRTEYDAYNKSLNQEFLNELFDKIYENSEIFL